MRFTHHLLYKYQRLRIWKYRFLSDCKNVQGKPTIRQPVQFVGKGTIKFTGKVNLGFYPSRSFLSGYIYLEARNPDSVIEIGNGVWINNNSALVSEGPGIFIGNRTTLGTNCEIVDSDFHDMHPDRRIDGVSKTAKVIIGENVYRFECQNFEGRRNRQQLHHRKRVGGHPVHSRECGRVWQSGQDRATDRGNRSHRQPVMETGTADYVEDHAKRYTVRQGAF